MTPAEIQRALRLITSKPQRQRFPITALAQLAGLSRETIYQARAGRGLTQRVVEALAPILASVLDGTLRARRWFCQETRKVRTSVLRADSSEALSARAGWRNVMRAYGQRPERCTQRKSSSTTW